MQNTCLAAGLGAFAALFAAVSADAADYRVKIINKTSYTMTSFHASNTKRNSWEEDMLGSKTIGPGGSFTANINDGTGTCMFDLRATFKGDKQAIRRGINVCKISSWTVTN